jgi:hypothetical protein
MNPTIYRSENLKGVIDLHIHTKASDGSLSCLEIVSLSEKKAFQQSQSQIMIQ